MHPTASNMQANGCMFYARFIGLYMHLGRFACMLQAWYMLLAGPVVCMLSACFTCMLQAYNMHSTCITNMYNEISDKRNILLAKIPQSTVVDLTTVTHTVEDSVLPTYVNHCTHPCNTICNQI